MKFSSVGNGPTRWPGKSKKRPRSGSCQVGGYKGLQGEQGCVNEPVHSSGKNDCERGGGSKKVDRVVRPSRDRPNKRVISSSLTKLTPGHLHSHPGLEHP